MRALPVRLRWARREELDAVVALDRATELAPHWPVAAYAAMLDATGEDAAPHAADGPSRCLIVAERLPVDGAVQTALLAGFAVGLMHPGPACGACVAEIEDVVVAAGCGRAGVGRALCVAVLDWCRSLGATEVMLEVRATNVGAIALYARLGFVEAGRRPGYYRDPEDDAVAMRLRWTAAAS
jgi:ribosomal-protein-alanine N-acetyltransferase